MGLESYQYRKISKISPSKYKPPKPVTEKPSVKSPPNISPPGLVLGKLPSHTK